MKIWFASGNVHKKNELLDILNPVSGIIKTELILPKDHGIIFSPIENGKTFLENALIKASALHAVLKERDLSNGRAENPVIIADDSGICVDAIEGRPGIYSARYGGDALNDSGRNELLLNEMENKDIRSARFVCAMVLYFGNDHFYSAVESMEGEIVSSITEARGEFGFGYDPILFIPSSNCTVAELSAFEKNKLSHRAKAGRAILGFINGIK